MTKEEILNQQHTVYVRELGTTSINPKEFPAAFKQAALNAMDEWAQQEAIAFAKWTAENLWTVYGDNWYPYQDEDNPIPASKLYELFLAQQLQPTTP